MREPRIGTLAFRNPVLTASGCFGMGGEFRELVDYSKIGGITLKTVTRAPRPGNLPPRALETPCGLLNSIGLENEGFEATLAALKERDAFAEYDTAVIFSLAGDTPRDFAEMARAFEPFEGIDMFELNLSCPNVHAGGRTFDCDAGNVTEIVSAVRSAIRKPFTTKLSPAQDLVGNALAAEKAGSPAVTVSNTFLGMAFDLKTGEPYFRNKVAGFSGPAVKPMALYNVWRVSQAVSVPVIASGGAACASDALEFLYAGAALVSVGTMNFVEPDAAATIAEGLAKLMK